MVTIGDLENNEIESIHIEGITNIPLIKGEQGEKGDKGDKGETNNIKIGTVETGEKASATLEGESPNQILNLVLPKGDKGEQGEPGIKPVKGIDYFTKEEIQKIKSNILDQVNQFSVLVVEELPTDNIDEHTIYFVPKTKTEQNDVYDEFIYINNGWEHIGTTEVDLSSYYKKDEIDTKLEAVEGNEVFVGNEEEAPSSAKIIIEDEDFEESLTLGKAEVYVGAEEPTAGEKVWFRKGKNVFNSYNIQTKYPNAKLNTKSNNSFSITNIGNWAYALLNLNLKPNTIYTLSADVTNSNGAYCGFYIDNNIDGCKNGNKSFKSVITFTTDETGVQNVFAYVNRSATTTASTYTVTFNNVQLEQGSKATSYEAYIEPQIFVRNSNGVYEEFIKKNEEVYSTEEQKIGTWIDGKPLYRKTIISNFEVPFVTQVTSYDIRHNISNIDKVVYAEMTDGLKHIPNLSMSGGTTTIDYVSSTMIEIRYINDSWSQRNWYITLEYTKTTD
jgi:hypothetical protein|nr:MAG TPA: hypothetical protein [Caudoviricetes sp.]